MFYMLSLLMSRSYDKSLINNTSSGFYFIFDKRYTFYSGSNEGVRGGGHHSYFLNNRTYHPKKFLPANKRVVYENKYYIVYKKSF